MIIVQLFCKLVSDDNRVDITFRYRGLLFCNILLVEYNLSCEESEETAALSPCLESVWYSCPCSHSEDDNFDSSDLLLSTN